MKANEAPEKIYLYENIFGRAADYWLREKSSDTDIEYTRTDAFIEKAVKWLKQNTDKYTWYNEFEGESGMMEEFTNDFQKAMNYGSTG